MSANDNKWHHIFLAWDNNDGSLKFYKDSVMSANYTDVKTGFTIRSGGSLVLGQGKDSLVGGFQSSQSFKDCWLILTYGITFFAQQQSRKCPRHVFRRSSVSYTSGQIWSMAWKESPEFSFHHLAIHLASFAFAVWQGYVSEPNNKLVTITFLIRS